MQQERLFIVIRKHLPKIIRDSQHTCPKCQTEETDKQLQTAEGDAEMCNIKKIIAIRNKLTIYAFFDLQLVLDRYHAQDACEVIAWYLWFEI